MGAVNDAPEQSATVLTHTPGHEKNSLLLDTLSYGLQRLTVLEQAINVHPENTELVETLLNACTDEETLTALITHQAFDGCNPAMMASLKKNSKTVKLLLNRCPKSALTDLLSEITNFGDNILSIVTVYTPDVIPTVLEKSPNGEITARLLTDQGTGGCNALFQSICKQVPVEPLVNAAPNMNTLKLMVTAIDNYGVNILSHSCFRGTPRLVEYLIQSLDRLPDKKLTEEAIQWVDKHGRNAIMNAAQSNPEVIPLLLGRGASISTMLTAREKHQDGWSVLEHAVGFHNSRYVIDLLDIADYLGILKTESERVQRRAMEYGNAPVLRHMKSRKYSLQPARDFFAGMTEEQQQEREDCRHILPSSDVPRQPEADSGVFSQNPGAAREALQAGADPNQRNLQGDTPLHLAVVKHDSPELVELLLEHKADLAQKTQGYTPLQAASLFSQSCITPLLKASLDKGLIRGERNFTMKNGLKTPRFCDESEDNGQQLLCGICHEVFRAGEMPILLPCFHHKVLFPVLYRGKHASI